jgi:hypothetical protein
MDELTYVELDYLNTCAQTLDWFERVYPFHQISQNGPISMLTRLRDYGLITFNDKTWWGFDPGIEITNIKLTEKGYAYLALKHLESMKDR